MSINAQRIALRVFQVRYNGTMRPEVSAGAIIFRRNKTKKRRDFLLLHYEAGHWDFAKGHLEGSETPVDAARREIFEETGLRRLRILPNFKHVIRYWMWSYTQKKRGRSVRIPKTVTFFIAEAFEDRVRLSNEHTGYVWLPYRDAAKLVTYKNAKELLRAAEELLQRQNQIIKTPA